MSLADLHKEIANLTAELEYLQQANKILNERKIEVDDKLTTTTASLYQLAKKYAQLKQNMRYAVK